MPADIRSKALGYLRSGAVRVQLASSVSQADRPYWVRALVHGFKSTYIVTLDGASAPWTCTCHQDECAHRAAVQLITGHESAAAPTPKRDKEPQPS